MTVRNNIKQRFNKLRPKSLVDTSIKISHEQMKPKFSILLWQKEGLLTLNINEIVSTYLTSLPPK